MVVEMKLVSTVSCVCVGEMDSDGRKKLGSETFTCLCENSKTEESDPNEYGVKSRARASRKTATTTIPSSAYFQPR